MGRELQDMERVVHYTTSRYLTETMSKTGFNSEKNVKGKSFYHDPGLYDGPSDGRPICWRKFSALTADEFRLRQAYQKHNTYVQSKVPAEDLLVWKVKDGWEPLCKFLNCPIPDGPIPHDNRTGDTKFIEGTVFHRFSPIFSVIAGISSWAFLKPEKRICVESWFYNSCRTDDAN